MSSFKTFFRAVVMLATLGLLAKAWYHYGPTLGELQAIGGRVVQVANEAWANYWQPPGTSSPLATDQPPTAATPPAPFAPPTGPVQPTRLPPAPAELGNARPVQLASGLAAEAAPAGATRSSPVARSWFDHAQQSPPPTAASLEPMDAFQQHDPLATLVDRLHGLGVRDQELKPWGSRGELVRFTCSVPWAESPNYTRQFEAVATTPLAAVQEVATEIEAWRAAR
jgi:hypothetical protein